MRQSDEVIVDAGNEPDVLVWYRAGLGALAGGVFDYALHGEPPATFRRSRFQPGPIRSGWRWILPTGPLPRSSFGNYAIDPGSASCSWSGGSGLSTGVRGGKRG